MQITKSSTERMTPERSRTRGDLRASPADQPANPSPRAGPRLCELIHHLERMRISRWVLLSRLEMCTWLLSFNMTPQRFVFLQEHSSRSHEVCFSIASGEAKAHGHIPSLLKSGSPDLCWKGCGLSAPDALGQAQPDPSPDAAGAWLPLA